MKTLYMLSVEAHQIISKILIGDEMYRIWKCMELQKFKWESTRAAENVFLRFLSKHPRLQNPQITVGFSN